MGVSNFDMIKANGFIGPQATGGKVFYVGNSSVVANGGKGSSNNNKGDSPLAPLATIDYAIGLCTAGRGDVIYVLHNHSETITAAITLDVANVSIIGLKKGNIRPVVIPNGVIDAMTVTADNCTIQGIEFAEPVTDAQTSDINIDASNCAIIDTLHYGSDTALNKVDIITLTANADSCLIDGVRIDNAVVEVPGGISIEGALNGLEIRNCYIFDSIGFTNGAIYDGATATNVYLHHNVIKNAKAGTVVLAFANNSTGICSFNHVSGRHTTLASNVTTGTGMDFFENRVTEEGSVNGAIVPAADID